MTSNIVLSGNGKIVTISTTRIEKVKANIINAFTPPSSTANNTPKDTIIINLKRITGRFTIKGFLKNGLGSSDTNSTATGKYDDLETLYDEGGDKSTLINMTYRGSNQIIIEKLSIIEIPTDEETNPSFYEILMTVLIGTGI